MSKVDRPAEPKFKPVRAIRDLPRGIAQGFAVRSNDKITAGAIGRYFAHNDFYCFETQHGYTPWVERRHVDMWMSQYFEPAEEGAAK